MRKNVLAIAAGAFLFGSTGSALAVTIGGLTLPTGPSFLAGQIYETSSVASIGDVLAGYGKVDSIGSTAVADLCAGCELTYAFGGYTVSSISASEVRFSGGWVKFYLGYGADKDFSTTNPGGSAGDLAEATNGTLFLSLKGHEVDAAGHTFIGAGVGIGTVMPAGFGTGLADVDTSAGGIANAHFNASAIPALFGGPADFEIGSSFSALHPVYPSECPGGAACLRGSVDLTVTMVPEPGSYALWLAGLAAIGFIGRRRQR